MHGSSHRKQYSYTMSSGGGQLTFRAVVPRFMCNVRILYYDQERHLKILQTFIIILQRSRK